MSVDLIRTSSTSYFDKRKFSSAEVFSVGRASRPRSDVISRPRISAELRICHQQDSSMHGASSQRAASEHTTHKDQASRRNITSFKQPMPGFELHMPRSGQEIGPSRTGPKIRTKFRFLIHMFSWAGFELQRAGPGRVG